MNTTGGRKIRIAFFDIESTNLAANFGYIICISWKWLGERKVHTVKISDSPTFLKNPTNDKFVVKEAAKALGEADAWVTWYGSKFDVPFIQTRLISHGLPIMPPVPHIDGWRIARYKLKLNSNRLQSVTSFLGCEDKTALKGEIWVRAMAGHAPSIRYIVRHCEQDVRVLEEVYHKIKPLMTTHPNINLVNAKEKSCPICGSKEIEKRGLQIARTAVKQRYRCKSCNGWSLGHSIPIKRIEIR